MPAASRRTTRSGAPRFPLSAARRLRVIDSETGRPLVGVEDMAAPPGRGFLILSATDRRAHARSPKTAPEGGLYALPLDALDLEEAPARPLLTAEDRARLFPAGFFPHGVAASADGSRLAAIVRPRSGCEVSLLVATLDEDRLKPLALRADRAFCRANDLDFDLDFAANSPTRLLVTLDRRHCRPAWADLRPGARTGRVIVLDPASDAPPEVVQTGLAFANGILGEWTAETRGARIVSRRDGRRIDLPGGPDNLTAAPDGSMVAALHPALLRLALWRWGVRAAAPSRVVRIARDGRIEFLFDDPRGEVFSAASAAALLDDRLVAGSPMDEGLLVCDPPQFSEGRKVATRHP